MCSVCDDFEQRLAAGNVASSLGAIAQVVERLHGMEEAGGSSPPSSTYKVVQASWLASYFMAKWCSDLRAASFTLAGFVAGEGSFVVTRALPNRADGSARSRFVLKVGVASRDRPLLLALQALLGGQGSIQDLPPAKAHWQPHSAYSINSRLRIRTVVIPFFDQFLLRSAKRDQFDRWRDEFEAYERAHPTQWGKGPSTCSEPGCDKPVRGRGLCRSHYCRATGY